MKAQPIQSGFKPIAGSEPIPQANPTEYHKIGLDIPRGNPKHIISRSSLSDFGSCPASWLKAPLKKITRAMKDGSLIDTMLLSPNRFDETYTVAPAEYPCKPTTKDSRTSKPWNNNASYVKEWNEEQAEAGKLVCTQDQVNGASQAISVLMTDPIVGEVLRHSDRQVQIMLEWHDGPTGLVIPVKILVDILPHAAGPFGKMIFDFKRTADATPDKWQRHCYDQEHFYQAAFYLDAVNAATGQAYQHFGNIVQESDAPFQVARRIFTPEFMGLGRMRYRQHMHFYCQCLAAGVWPGYEDFDLDNPLHPVIDGWRMVDTLPWMLKKEV